MSKPANRPSSPTIPGTPARLLERPARESDEQTIKFLRRGPNRQLLFPTLRVVAGRDMLRYVTLNADDEVLVGRDEDGGLVLSDPSVSRRHARVRCSDTGVVTVADLGSTNGTAVNGKLVEQSPLQAGDHLEVGAVSLRLDLLSIDELAHLENVLARLEANNRDPLTGLLTRAWLDDELPTLAEMADADGRPFACLFVDVDRFKSINDRFGHQVGDDVLVGVARLLMLGVRDSDACVRYGGEEMVMFLRDAAEDGAWEVAERIRRTIEDHEWARTRPGLAVTVSIGVALRTRDEPVRDWLNRADRALYAAKGRGRNRTVRASELQ